jgi:hypothetical protein
MQRSRCSWIIIMETVFSMWFMPKCYKQGSLKQRDSPLCGGGVEYLHRDPASHRRRRKGKSQIWDSKIRSRFPRDSDPIKKDRPILSSERSWSWAPYEARHQDLLTDWLTDRQSQSDFDFDLTWPVQLSEVTWSKWLVGERVQLQFSWKSVCEEKTRRLVRNGRQPGTQLVELSVDKEFCKGGCDKRTRVREAEESTLVGAVRKRLEETNGLRTLVCVCQWSVNCSSERCIQMFNKYNIQSIPRLQSHTTKYVTI